jgi:anaerobic C4-dicarboxylate transporter
MHNYREVLNMPKIKLNTTLIKDKGKKEMVRRIALLIFLTGILVIYCGGIRTGNYVGQTFGLVIISVGCILMLVT